MAGCRSLSLRHGHQVTINNNTPAIYRPSIATAIFLSSGHFHATLPRLVVISHCHAFMLHPLA